MSLNKKKTRNYHVDTSFTPDTVVEENENEEKEDDTYSDESLGHFGSDSDSELSSDDSIGEELARYYHEDHFLSPKHLSTKLKPSPSKPFLSPPKTDTVDAATTFSLTATNCSLETPKNSNRNRNSNTNTNTRSTSTNMHVPAHKKLTKKQKREREKLRQQQLEQEQEQEEMEMALDAKKGVLSQDQGQKQAQEQDSLTQVQVRGGVEVMIVMM